MKASSAREGLIKTDRLSPLAAVLAAALLAAGALAQNLEPVAPDAAEPLAPRGEIPGDFAPSLDDEAILTLEGAEPAEPEPELSREERMDQLFVELGEAANDEDAAFIAEEIEALWRDSGSATVDLLTDRATDALDMGEAELARELIDGALELGPEHAEAWAESARIAMVEEELGIALQHIERAVSLEPRHYYALTELGLILERLDSPTGAFEAFQRALDLNPRLPDAVEGKARTERAAQGRSL